MSLWGRMFGRTEGIDGQGECDRRRAPGLEPGSPDTYSAEFPEWFAGLQAHVTAVHANDTAVRLFREGRLDEAITELRRGLETSPPYATGYSNLGFLYLRKGALEQAVECLLQALAVDPRHRDAPDHLGDVLLALCDELLEIGVTDGFLSKRPGGKFDQYNRHVRAREIGSLIAKIGDRGVFKADGLVLESDRLMEVVIHEVQQKMSAHHHATGLPFVWQGIHGWNPPVAIPRSHSSDITHRVGCSGVDVKAHASWPWTPGQEGSGCL
jgi:TPR repeat